MVPWRPGCPASGRRVARVFRVDRQGDEAHRGWGPRKPPALGTGGRRHPRRPLRPGPPDDVRVPPPAERLPPKNRILPLAPWCVAPNTPTIRLNRSTRLKPDTPPYSQVGGGMHAETLSAAHSGKIGHQPPGVRSRTPGQGRCRSILVDVPTPVSANPYW